DQQVEGAGEQREAQHLHQEHRIDEDRRDDEDRQHDQERDGEAARSELARRRGQGGVGRAGGHAVLPNRPAGRISSTIAMMMKMTVWEASGKNTLVRRSMTPRAKPVTIAPMMEPMPPITTTANTTMMRSAPICGLTLVIGAAMTPASAASPTPTPYVTVIKRGT